jgi:hypothetical protein
MADDVRVKGPIEGIRRNHGLVAVRTHDLLTSLAELTGRCRRDYPNNAQALVEFYDARDRDPAKFASEDVLLQSIALQDPAEGFFSVLNQAVEDAQVPLYSLIHLQLAVLSSYLGRPKLVRRSLEAVGELLQALGEDMASKIMPVALIKAVFAQAVSDFDREEARLTQMTTEWSRLYWLDDSLGALVTNSYVIEGVIRASDRSLQDAQARLIRTFSGLSARCKLLKKYRDETRSRCSERLGKRLGLFQHAVEQVEAGVPEARIGDVEADHLHEFLWAA